MFASRAFAGFQDSGRNTLDVPVAALAGLAMAFVVFAAPADLLANLVAATGLPSILPAAEPPLGMKARLGLGAGGAVVMFGLTFLLLRWLDRFGRRRAEEAEAVAEMEAPRLRRRDVHPDAPARAPLLAVHELGEPELELTQVEPAEPEPWLQEASPIAPPPQPEAWAAPEPAPEPTPSPTKYEPEPVSRSAPLQLDAAACQADAYALSQRIWSVDESDDETEAEPEPVEENEWRPEPFGREPEQPESVEPSWSPEPAPAAEPDWTDDSEPPTAEEPAPQTGWERLVEAPQPWPAAPVAESAPEPEPESVEPSAHQPGSIAELMERLEQGLARRRFTPPAGTASAAAPPIASTPATRPEPADDRLQNAIESLQRFASRQD